MKCVNNEGDDINMIGKERLFEEEIFIFASIKLFITFNAAAQFQEIPFVMSKKSVVLKDYRMFQQVTH